MGLFARGRRPDRVVGLVGLLGVVLVVLLAMNAGRLPLIGQGGRTVQADFADIGGLQVGDRVEAAGIDIGHVDALDLAAGHIRVTFTVDHGVRLGSATRAAIKVTNLLGSKYVEVTSAGGGELDGEIPVERTSSPYDLTTAFGGLTRKLEPIDTGRLEQALDAISDTFRNTGGDVRAAMRGLSAISRTVASRDTEIGSLLRRADTFTGSLDRSRTDVAGLLRAARLLLGELDHRRRALAGLIRHTRALSVQLSGLVRDNQATTTPALRALDAVTRQLQDRQRSLRLTLHQVAKFARVFVNTIGNGPWFDSYIGNAPDSLKLEDPQ